MRYVEMQLAKTKEILRETNLKVEQKSDEVTQCHEQMSRQANINHAQATQIEDISKKLQLCDDRENEMNEKHQVQVTNLKNAITMGESSI